MPKVELEATSEATSEAREATFDLTGAEMIADVTDAAVAAYAGGGLRRTRGCVVTARRA
jgi:hypothetical protein